MSAYDIDSMKETIRNLRLLLETSEAREKDKDEDLCAQFERAMKKAGLPVNTRKRVNAWLFPLSTPTPSQPVKVAEEKPCEGPGHSWRYGHPCEICCPPAEKLTGTGEKELRCPSCRQAGKECAQSYSKECPFNPPAPQPDRDGGGR